MNDEVQRIKEPNYGPLPVKGLPVQVQCVNFKCMAFLDADGKWKDFFSRKFLPHVLGVVAA
jgi:hypothetical protein